MTVSNLILKQNVLNLCTKAHQKALIPFDLKDQIHNLSPDSKKYFFSLTKPSTQELASLTPQETLFYLDNNTIIMVVSGISTFFCVLIQLPRITFDQNWLIICATLYSMSLPLAQLPLIAPTLSIPEHRLEKCASIHNKTVRDISIHNKNIHDITIYNDSKSTTPAATLAAVHQLKQRPIILILGGLSKGVDRAPFIAQLKNNVKKIYAFGAESEHLAHICTQHAIPATAYLTLKETVEACLSYAQAGDQILFLLRGVVMISLRIMYNVVYLLKS